MVFSPSTQALILHVLWRKETGLLAPAAIANRLGYSAMTMTRAFDELEAADIGEHSVMGKERHVRFPETGKPLWEKVLAERVKKGKFFLPTREGLIALKYLAAISPNRSYENKSQDVADMIKLLAKADRERMMNYISILGEVESKKFTESVLRAYEEKKPVIV